MPSLHQANPPESTGAAASAPGSAAASAPGSAAASAPGSAVAAAPGAGILSDARQNLSDPSASVRDRKNLSLHQANPPESRPLGPYGLPLEWQFPAVPSPYWHYALPDGGVRLYSVEQAQKSAPETPDWRQMKNLLLQKFPAERFTVVAKLVFHPNPQLGEKLESAGFLVSGDELAGFNLVSAKDGARLHFFISRPEGDHVVDEVEEETAWIPYDKNREATCWIKLEVCPKDTGTPVPVAECRFFYSLDGKRFSPGMRFIARPEQWIGAKFGFFCNRYAPKNDAGWLDILDLRVVPESNPQ